MIEFLKKDVLKKRNNLIIMDNSPSHKSLKIEMKLVKQQIIFILVFHIDQKQMLLKVGLINLSITLN